MENPEGYRGWTIWLTGLPASGKTTIARAMKQRLKLLEMNVVLLDSDELRQVLTPRASYTPDERDFFYSALVGLAGVLSQQGMNVIIAATGNRRLYRQWARERLSPFVEVWVQCPIEVCKARDPKGLYAQAIQQDHSTLPGIGVGYEESDRPDIIIDSHEQTPEEAAEQIIEQCIDVEKCLLI